MYYLLGIMVVLAAFLAANAAGSLLAALVWRIVRGTLAPRLTPYARADLLFALRAAPAALALVSVATLLAPAYFIHEPAGAEDEVGFKLAALALLAAAGLALAAWRAAASFAATRRVRRALMRRARPLALRGVCVPAFRVEHQLPLVAVVGVFRPKMFVASRLFDELGADEIAAAAAHELGHVSARDNLKRTLMRACRDALLVAPWSRQLERAWSAEAESAADEFAARAGGRAQAISLASALVKIARMMPDTGLAAMPGVALLVDGEANVAERVDRLLALASSPATDYDPRGRNLARRSVALGFLTIFVSILLLATQTDASRTLYHALEHAVAALS
ncbi:MAG TPA: M48 family metalloprotease [Pyrinomonadaceae bacterium]|jgi:Zn-dependent protease with chaperone function|nr:M48 family metalloprotease [Pyrinomonadaceae bacterium]